MSLPVSTFASFGLVLIVSNGPLPYAGEGSSVAAACVPSASYATDGPRPLATVGRIASRGRKASGWRRRAGRGRAGARGHPPWSPQGASPSYSSGTGHIITGSPALPSVVPSPQARYDVPLSLGSPRHPDLVPITPQPRPPGPGFYPRRPSSPFSPTPSSVGSPGVGRKCGGWWPALHRIAK